MLILYLNIPSSRLSTNFLLDSQRFIFMTVIMIRVINVDILSGLPSMRLVIDLVCVAVQTKWT